MTDDHDGDVLRTAKSKPRISATLPHDNLRVQSVVMTYGDGQMFSMDALDDPAGLNAVMRALVTQGFLKDVK